VAKVLRNSAVAGLARASRKDIDRAWEALREAARPRIHTFISTSPLHMKFKLQMEPDAVHQAIIDSVTHARNLCEDVEWSAEDASRTDRDFLCRCVETAIKAGARTVNIPDTVGYAIPEEFAGLIEMLRNRVPNIDKAVISVHCHNDLGLAVANSLAAVSAGARQVECTINGWASGRAMRRWRRSSWRCARATTSWPSPPASTPPPSPGPPSSCPPSPASPSSPTRPSSAPMLRP
jgi:Isopropylmalate/homocitrate/citramalate synthases